MWYGKFSDRYNGKKKDRKRKKHHEPATADKALIKKHKFVNFFRQMVRRRAKV